MRRLLLVPIVHSQSDLGSLASVVNDVKTATLGADRLQAVIRSVEQFWRELTQTLQTMQLDYDRLLIYQDGLPVIENSALQLELQIVSDLARNGSPNHRLVKWFVDQGACLLGTESAPLLMKEYAAIRKSLAEGFREIEGQPNTYGPHEPGESSPPEPPLIQQRDQFIARRIAETLGNNQVGLLFIGMLHHVEAHLDDDISVEYPIGRPRFLTRTSAVPQLTIGSEQ